MTRLKLSLLAGALGSLTALGVLQVLHQRRDEERKTLRAANEGMRRAAFDRQRELTLASSGPAPTAPPSLPAPEVPNPQRARPSDYRNEGQATPVAALQTFAWACDQGDVDSMKRLLLFAPAARPKAERLYAALPLEVRTRAPDLESFAALLFVEDGMRNPFPSAELLARASLETVSADQVRTRLPGTARDGGLYQRVGNKWKFVVTEQAVDDYAASRAYR